MCGSSAAQWWEPGVYTLCGSQDRDVLPNPIQLYHNACEAQFVLCVTTAVGDLTSLLNCGLLSKSLAHPAFWKYQVNHNSYLWHCHRADSIAIGHPVVLRCNLSTQHTQNCFSRKYSCWRCYVTICATCLLLGTWTCSVCSFS